MYQADSVCLCDEPKRHFVDEAVKVDYAAGHTRGVCTQCNEHVHVETRHVTCISCDRNIPVVDGEVTERIARIQRGDFDLDLPENDNVKCELFVCEKCYLEDESLCRFFNRTGHQIR